ncbi:beta-2 adrenergic receptor-like [Antedon mediterranea]|uniref:beta-2 adrenergic receptor-like n=1 Tax=Antedon mediterranea TaxID=105859 RepID=UPI003AF56F07
MDEANCSNLCCSQRDNASEDYDNVSVIQSVIIALLILPTIIGNLLVITLICKYRPLHTMTSVLLMNLSIADCGVGIFVTPFAFLNSLSTITDVTGLCKASGILNVTFCLTSTTTLTAIAIERYCAITQPFRYHKIVTQQGLTITIILIWSLSFLWSIIPFAFDNNYIYFPDNYVCILDFSNLKIFSSLITTICFVIPLCTISFCYISIYIVAKQQLKKINDIQVAGHRRSCTDEPSLQETEISNNAIESEESSRNRRTSRSKGVQKSRKSNGITKSTKTIKELKAAFTLLVVMAIYLICWLPYNLGIICHISEDCRWSCMFYRMSTILVLVSSMCNPIVYFIRFKQYRKYLKMMFKCQKNDNPIVVLSIH